jgi:hypothetical protein
MPRGIEMGAGAMAKIKESGRNEPGKAPKGAKPQPGQASKDLLISERAKRIAQEVVQRTEREDPDISGEFDLISSPGYREPPGD